MVKPRLIGVLSAAALACGLLVAAPAVGAQASTACPADEAVIYVYSHDTGTQYDLTGNGNEKNITVDTNAGDCFFDGVNKLWQWIEDANGLCLGYNQDLGLVQEQTCNFNSDITWQQWYPKTDNGYDGGTTYQNLYAYYAGDPDYMAAGGLVGGDGVTLSSDRDSVLTSWYAAQQS
jgi:hypothetical protein